MGKLSKKSTLLKEIGLDTDRVPMFPLQQNLDVCIWKILPNIVGWLLGCCVTPYQRLRLYNGAPFSRLLRHTGDTEDVFST